MIGNNYLKQWREFRGLSLREASKKTDNLITCSAISKTENGKNRWTQRMLELLADAYGAEPWQLLGVNPLNQRNEK